MGTAVEAVVFDLGGVITNVTRDLYSQFAAEAGIPVEALGPVFTDGYEGLAEMELGHTTFSDYIAKVCADLGDTYDTTVDNARLLECVDASLYPVDEMITLIGEVRCNHKTAILTNNNPELVAMWEPRLPPDLVDVVVNSSVVGMRKPDAAIYEHTVDLLGIPLGRAVFVDDTRVNVEAARECGMLGVVFESPQQCRKELLDFGVQLG